MNKQAKAVLSTPVMSDYLTKALITGVEKNRLRLVSMCNVASKIDGENLFSRALIRVKLGGAPMEYTLSIFNADQLEKAGGSDGDIFAHSFYKVAGSDQKDDGIPAGADRWVNNYVPQDDVFSERSLSFLNTRPDEGTYEIACLLLDLMDLPKEHHLALVYLDNIGLRHVLCLPNENDGDPEVTYVLIHQPGRENFRRPNDYRLPLLSKNPPALLRLLLRELHLDGDGDRDDIHPLDTDEEKVQWGYGGPYAVQYGLARLLIYTAEAEGVLPAHPLLIVADKALASAGTYGIAPHRMQWTADIRWALENIPALYQPHPASELARDFLACLMKQNSFETVLMFIRVDHAGQSTGLTLIQGDAAIDFNLQY